MYYVYVIRNAVAGHIYIGYTNDLRRRLAEHKQKKPALLYYEAYRSEQDVRNRETMLKQRGQAIRRLKERIAQSLLK